MKFTNDYYSELNDSVGVYFDVRVTVASGTLRFYDKKVKRATKGTWTIEAFVSTQASFIGTNKNGRVESNEGRHHDEPKKEYRTVDGRTANWTDIPGFKLRTDKVGLLILGNGTWNFTFRVREEGRKNKKSEINFRIKVEFTEGNLRTSVRRT